MITGDAVALRVRAAHARRLADKVYDRGAESDLRKVADAFEAEADEIERGDSSNNVPPAPDLS